MGWDSLGSLKGATGTAGAKGDKGDTGSAGSNATATTDASALTSGTLAAARLPLVANPPVALTYAASLTPVATAGNYRVCTLTGNPTLNPPSSPTDGQKIHIRFLAGASARTVTIASGIKLATGITATLAVPANKRSDIGLHYEAADGWTCLAATAQQ